MEVVRALMRSKKAVVALTSLLTVVAIRFLGLDEEMAMKITEQLVTLATVYIGGQGLADAGKGIGEGLFAGRVRSVVETAPAPTE